VRVEGGLDPGGLQVCVAPDNLGRREVADRLSGDVDPALSTRPRLALGGDRSRWRPIRTLCLPLRPTSGSPINHDSPYAATVSYPSW
jgi:hypothetical protein